jgi:hypothetical protein
MTRDHDGRSSDDRISALENQVRRLEAMLAGGGGGQGQQAPAAYDRRSLLRRGGAALAAGAAGALVLPQLTGSAAAATGGPVLLGNSNTADAATTITDTTNPGGAATLALANTGPARAGNVGAPPLRVAASTLSPDPATSVSGDFFVQAGSNGIPTQLLFTHESPSSSGGQAIPAAIGSVYTDYLANLFVPVLQNSSARAYHQVLPAKGVGTMNFQPFLQPDGFLIAAIGVLQVNNTQGGSGYLTLYPHNTSRPAVSAISWGPAGSRLSTLAIAIPGDHNLVNVYASLAAEVFFDVVGLLVPSPASVADAHLGATASITANSQRAEKLRAQHTARF